MTSGLNVFSLLFVLMSSLSAGSLKERQTMSRRDGQRWSQAGVEHMRSRGEKNFPWLFLVVGVGRVKERNWLLFLAERKIPKRRRLKFHFFPSFGL
jgi:hypothetical protein